MKCLEAVAGFPTGVTPITLRESDAKGLADFFLLLTSTPCPAETLADRQDVDAIKAGFIYNFSRFIRWPSAESTQRPQAFVIAVIDDPVMGEQLKLLDQQGRRVDGLPIRVETVADPAAIPESSILFVGTDAGAKLDRILDRVANRPVLVIGDTPGWARRGVAINFYRRRDRVRFEINPRALRGAGLTAEAQLFDVARIVE